MTEWVQYGALGLLGATLAGAFVLARAVVTPYLRDALETNRELRDLCRALREALVGQGQRMARMEGVLGEVHEIVRELWREQGGGTWPGRKPKKS